MVPKPLYRLTVASPGPLRKVLAPRQHYGILREGAGRAQQAEPLSLSAPAFLILTEKEGAALVRLYSQPWR